jgi:hypothetical protein
MKPTAEERAQKMIANWKLSSAETSMDLEGVMTLFADECILDGYLACVALIAEPSEELVESVFEVLRDHKRLDTGEDRYNQYHRAASDVIRALAAKLGEK